VYGRIINLLSGNNQQHKPGRRFYYECFTKRNSTANDCGTILSLDNHRRQLNPIFVKPSAVNRVRQVLALWFYTDVFFQTSVNCISQYIQNLFGIYDGTVTVRRRKLYKAGERLEILRKCTQRAQRKTGIGQASMPGQPALSMDANCSRKVQAKRVVSTHCCTAESSTYMLSGL